MALDLQQIVEPVLRSEDSVIHHTFANVLRWWSKARKDLPRDFGRKLIVTHVMRQPVAILHVRKQHVRRTLEPKQRPYDGGPVNDRRWPTQDLYELEPYNSLLFPDAKKVERLRVTGQERIATCEQCRGGGNVDCPQCNGKGRLVCRTCDGANRMECDRCGGKGGVIDVRGYLVECVQCRGVGACECPGCDDQGQATCVLCRGNGKRRCRACSGRGRFRTSWTLLTETVSRHDLRLRMSEPWDIPLNEFTDDSQLLRSWQWRREELPAGIDALQQELPDCLHQELKTLLREFASPVESYSLSDHDRVTGIQLELRGTMLHRVDFQYLGRPGAAFVGGEQHHVIPQKLPLLDRGVMASIKRGVGAFWNEVHEDVREELSSEFVRRADLGEVHFADDRCLAPSAAELLGAQLDVTSTGYDLALQSESPAGPVWFAIALDADEAGTLTLCSQSILGPANRDRYPDALSAGADLEFGRIAVLELAGESFFALVDRRPYVTLGAEHLAKVWEVMSLQAMALIANRLLG